MAKTCGERRAGQRLGRSDHAPSSSQRQKRRGLDIEPKGTYRWRKSKEKQKEKRRGKRPTRSSSQGLVVVQNGIVNPSWNSFGLFGWLRHPSLFEKETTITSVCRDEILCPTLCYSHSRFLNTFYCSYSIDISWSSSNAEMPCSLARLLNSPSSFRSKSSGCPDSTIFPCSMTMTRLTFSDRTTPNL